MIEDGKVTYPVKGATLIGNGPDALTRVSMVGNDLASTPAWVRAARMARAYRSAWGSRRYGSTASQSAERRSCGRLRSVGSPVQRPGSRRVGNRRRRRCVMTDDAPAGRRSHQHVRRDSGAARAFIAGLQVLDRTLHRESDRLEHDDLVEGRNVSFVLPANSWSKLWRTDS